MAEQQCQRLALAPFSRRGDVLTVRHGVGEKHHHASHNPPIASGGVEFDIFGKTAVEQLDFLHRVHGFGLVARGKHLFQHMPIAFPVGTFAHFHSSPSGGVHGALVATVEIERIGEQHRSGDIALGEHRSCTEKRIQVFLGRITVIDVRHGLIIEGGHAIEALVFQPFSRTLHHSHHHRGIEVLDLVKPTAVGEPLVAKERFAYHIGRQHRHQSFIAVRH